MDTMRVNRLGGVTAALVALGVVGGVVALAWPAQAATSNATIQGYAFHPDPIVVNQNDTVVWKNLDAVPHNVRGPAGINSANLNLNDTYSYHAATPGTFTYACTIHGFTATLTVRAAAPATTAPAVVTTRPPTTSSKPAPATTAKPTTTTPAPTSTSTAPPTASTFADATTPAATDTTVVSGAAASLPKHHESSVGPLLAAIAVVLLAAAAVAAYLYRERRIG